MYGVVLWRVSRCTRFSMLRHPKAGNVCPEGLEDSVTPVRDPPVVSAPRRVSERSGGAQVTLSTQKGFQVSPGVSWVLHGCLRCAVIAGLHKELGIAMRVQFCTVRGERFLPPEKQLCHMHQKRTATPLSTQCSLQP